MKRAERGSSMGCIVCGEKAYKFRMCRPCFKAMRFDQQMRFDLSIPECSVQGCRRMEELAGKCGLHYERYISGSSETPRYTGRECHLLGCKRESMLRHPLCRYHKKFAGRYGMSSEKFLSVMESNLECQVCGSMEDLHIDHDHSCCDIPYGTCGECNRGVLCRGCNMAIGYAKDNPQTLVALAGYLESGQRL